MSARIVVCLLASTLLAACGGGSSAEKAADAEAIATSGRTYTPAELKVMLQTGKPPAQGKPESQSKEASFGACVLSANEIASAIENEYPVETLVSTATVFMKKMWTNDGAIVVTCSDADRKMVITRSPYI